MAEDESPEEEAEEEHAPPAAYIAKVLPDLFEHWKERNEWIAEMRSHANVTNKIEVPADTRFTVKPIHMGTLRAARNERLARFLQAPKYRVIPPGPSDPAQSYASKLERATNGLIAELRRNNDDFGRTVGDVLTVEGGAMLWEANSQAAWPRLTVGVDGYDDIIRDMPDGDPDDEKSQQKALQAKVDAREKYKRDLGNSQLSKLFTHSHVPYECLYPFPDEVVPSEFIHVEFRSVRKVLDNDLFSDEAKGSLRRAMDASDGFISFKQVVPIIRYCNCETYAYYLIPEIMSPQKNQTLIKQLTDKYSQGAPQGVELLYSYEHDAGVPLYTQYIGSEGGWNSGDNEDLKGKLRSLSELNTARDDLASQEYTNIRNRNWPNMVTKTSLERPAQPLNDNDPRQIKPRGTGDLDLYVGEEIAPMPMNPIDPMMPGFKADIVESLAKLTGAPGLFGIHQSGVDGGFQESTLLSQAESSFARTEANIVTAAVNDVLVLYSLIKAIGEKVWVKVETKNAEGRKYFESLCIDPKQLEPMPAMDATVKAPPVADQRQQLANYAAATADITGPGTAAMDRKTARESYLNIEQPDEMETRVLLQAVQDQVVPGIVAEEVKKKYNLLSVDEQKALAEAGTMDAQAMFAGDPALAADMGAFANGMPPPGQEAAMAMDPALMPNPAGTQGMNGGLPYGEGQPDQTMGRIDGILEQGGLA
jgi:hypothetical protein